jgi:hypothetical protein
MEAVTTCINMVGSGEVQIGCSQDICGLIMTIVSYILNSNTASNLKSVFGQEINSKIGH